MKVVPEVVEFQVSIDSWSEFYQPGYQIFVDRDLIVTTAEMTRGQTYCEKFSHLITPGSHELKIRLLAPGGQSHIRINYISINSAKLELVDHGEYRLDRPRFYSGQTVSTISKVNTLGWAGEYVIQFRSPTVLWFLTDL